MRDHIRRNCGFALGLLFREKHGKTGGYIVPLNPFVRLPCTSRAHVIVSINSPHADTPPKSACIRLFWKRLLFGRCFSHPKRERFQKRYCSPSKLGSEWTLLFRVLSCNKIIHFRPVFQPLLLPECFFERKRPENPCNISIFSIQKAPKKQVPEKIHFLDT